VLIECLYEMHGATIKMVNAQQAKFNNNYKKNKLKLLRQMQQYELISECFKNVTLARNSVAP